MVTWQAQIFYTQFSWENLMNVTTFFCLQHPW